MRNSVRWLVLGLAAVLALGSQGCGSISGFLNPEFLTALGIGESVATLPGDAPAIVLGVENRTSRTIEAVVSYRVGVDSVSSFVAVVEPGEKTARAVVCPIDAITLGDVNDLSSIGARVRLGNGTPQDPVIEVEPFGVLLRNGANYNCGDGVTFAITNSAATLSGYQVFAFIQRAQ